MNFRTFRRLAGLILAAMLLSACNIGLTPPPPTQDVGAIQTQAFGSVLTQAAQNSTQTAVAIPPTPIPTNTIAPTNTLPAIPTSDAFGIPTNTPFTFNTQQPGLTPQAGGLSFTATVGSYSTVTTQNGCSNGYLVSESQPYDGKTILFNTDFTKSWDFINTGTCAWDEGYTFAFVAEFSTGPIYVLPKKDYIIPKTGPFVKPGATGTFSVPMRAPKDPGDYTWYFKLKDDAGQYFGSLVWVRIISVRE
ncbi:MAG: hypothetical protein IPP55_06990 [Anaerolineales bacterium]|nr:hypothetical protein [Anaerolineales bacterium]